MLGDVGELTLILVRSLKGWRRFSLRIIPAGNVNFHVHRLNRDFSQVWLSRSVPSGCSGGRSCGLWQGSRMFRCSRLWSYSKLQVHMISGGAGRAASSAGPVTLEYNGAELQLP